MQIIKYDLKELKDIISLFGYKQLRKKPARVTHESRTVIGLILSNNECNNKCSSIN